MALDKSEIPCWTDDVLQALCYWIGHRYSYYSDYPLGEAALVGELCNILSSKISEEYRLLSEVMHSKLGIENGGRNRCDLVIVNKRRINREADVSKFVMYAIEVKRYISGVEKLNEDLYRLKQILEIQRKLNRNGRVFLIVISQRKRPSEYVTEKGNAKKSLQSCRYDENEIKFYVRRTCKAVNSFSRNAVNSAYYSILIEVVLEDE